MNRKCYACRKHLKNDGAINNMQTRFCCSVCKTSFCKESHHDTSISRNFTYFDENAHADEDHLQNDGYYICKSTLPNDKLVN